MAFNSKVAAMKKRNIEIKGYSCQIGGNINNTTTPNNSVKKQKRAMLVALASLLAGREKEAEFFLRVGLIGADINDALDMKKYNSLRNKSNTTNISS